MLPSFEDRYFRYSYEDHPENLSLTLIFQGASFDEQHMNVKIAIDQALLYCTEKHYTKLILDMIAYSYASSQCLPYITELINREDRPLLHVLAHGEHDPQHWQNPEIFTLLRNAKQITSNLNLLCQHSITYTKEENFFAPTGSGSIRTSDFCQDCGYRIYQSSEYFD